MHHAYLGGYAKPSAGGKPVTRTRHSGGAIEETDTKVNGTFSVCTNGTLHFTATNPALY